MVAIKIEINNVFQTTLKMNPKQFSLAMAQQPYQQ